MKKIFNLIILLFTFWSHAQNGITYQAVILNPNTEELPGADNSRLPLVNQRICLEFKILNASSALDYQETINTQTDEFGMVNVIIGTGTRKAGIATQFSVINWDGAAKSLIVSIDPTSNCSNFIEISNQPFTYVPFALYAAHTGTTGTQGPAGNNGLDGKTVLNGTTIPNASIGTNGDFYINTATSNLFGPKTNGDWGNGVPLVGPQGIQGPQGIAGVNGTNGSNGFSAYQIWLNAGNTGTEAQFLTALRGVTGAQGPQGIQGIQGPIGLTGATGPQGIAGTNGANGLSAYQIWLNAGNAGTEAQFLTALRGVTGAQGPQGIQGIQGPIGLTGATGPQGIAGTNGANGLSAYQIWLNAGNTGTEAQFLTALRGATGAQGPQGIQGPIGPTGATGPQGIAGVNGTNGSNGLSAYQIWLNAGNTGTEAQFLTALRGATGAQGAQGIQGPIGPTGAQGIQGIAGTNGTNGTNGVNGQDGLSAYQIWLNEGNTGTEAQFLTALRGATGAQGSQGIQGIAGTNGTNGLDGKTVLNGTQSPTAGIGNNGDFYINTTTNTLFGPKTSGAWGSGVSLVGPQGAAGTNGKNTLVNTTTEAAGANCATGGTKIEVGIDTNSNGVLDSGEVNSSLTKYVCNGNQGVSNSTSGYEQLLEILNQNYSIAPNQNIPITITGINSKHIYIILNTGHQIYTESAISIEVLDSNNNRINISNDFIYVEKSGSPFNGSGGTVNFETNKYNDTLFYKSFRIPNPNNTSPSGIIKLDVFAENTIAKINIILIAGRNENTNYPNQNITPYLIVKKSLNQ